MLCFIWPANMAAQTEVTVPTLSLPRSTRFALWMDAAQCRKDQLPTPPTIMQAHCLFTGGSNEIVDIFTDHVLDTAHTEKKNGPSVAGL